ncbi:hypothetical protein [Winogradskya humida]|uniref:Uncharacterized protein n=1 Tax=Winogradskya humida TaxID=113566 RepID=A0ABQ4A1T6_9ACTN|nr:hypothetical protein [Actinoplanes humidus]GIE24827.1 hypothetical protein Ahu01nite_079290 [Actinoplanes humidus]
MAHLNAAIADSSIPDAIAQFGADVRHENEPSRYRINSHTNDAGDWCRSLYTVIAETASNNDGRCPAGCANGAIEADDRDDDPPNLTDCQLCGAPGGYPYCASTFGGRMSCVEAVTFDEAAEPDR